MSFGRRRSETAAREPGGSTVGVADRRRLQRVEEGAGPHVQQNPDGEALDLRAFANEDLVRKYRSPRHAEDFRSA